MYLKSIDKEIKDKSFTTIIGSDEIIKGILSEKDSSFAFNKYLNIFNGETIFDEIAFGLENKALKKTLIKKVVKDYAKKFDLDSLLERDPLSLGSSDKAKVKICNALVCRTKVLIINELFSELDYKDLKLVLNLLNDYIKLGGTIINITSNIEESIYGNYLIIYKEGKIAIEGETLSVLNEEKLLKRLNLGLPFYVELCKYLKDYNLINKYYLDSESLVDALWK